MFSCALKGAGILRELDTDIPKLQNVIQLEGSHGNFLNHSLSVDVWPVAAGGMGTVIPLVVMATHLRQLLA